MRKHFYNSLGFEENLSSISIYYCYYYYYQYYENCVCQFLETVDGTG